MHQNELRKKKKKTELVCSTQKAFQLNRMMNSDSTQLLGSCTYLCKNACKPASQQNQQ